MSRGKSSDTRPCGALLSFPCSVSPRRPPRAFSLGSLASQGFRRRPDSRPSCHQPSAMAPSLEGQPRGAGCAPVGATTVCLLCREAGHERTSGEAGLCGGAGRGHRPAGSLSSLLGLDTVQPWLRRPRGGGSDDRGQQGVVAVALCRSGSAWASWPTRDGVLLSGPCY